MSANLCSPRRMVWISALPALVSLCSLASAQNLTVQLGDSNPLRLGSIIPESQDFDFSTRGKFKGALIVGTQADVVYNSNFYLTEDNEDDEISAVLTPWFKYISDPEGGAEASLEANYRPAFMIYHDNSDLNDVNQAGDITLKLKGSRTELTAYGWYEQVAGTDRLTNSYVEGALFTGGIRGVRQIAPRTALHAEVTAAVTEYTSGGAVGAQVFSGKAGAAWRASERLTFGPTIGFTRAESDNTGGTDAWSLLIDARYQLGDRIWLTSTFGPEFSQTAGVAGGADSDNVNLSADLRMKYLISERWTWNNTIRSATVPAPSDTNYLVNDISVMTELQRNLLRGWVSGGLEYHLSGYQDIGNTATARGDENNVSVFMTYQRNIIPQRAYFNTTVRYTSNDGLVDWSQWMISAGFNAAF